MGDDFITIPLPQIAAAPSSTTNRIVNDAVHRYQEEKAVVDDRLARKVDVEMPVGDLRSLMDLLHHECGVLFTARPDLQDLKLTVLMKQMPVRDLMRQVARLFNLEWRRSGEDGHYTYLLSQSLKQRLAEEEAKRQDQDQMVLNLDKEMNRYLPYLDRPAEELSALAKAAEDRAKSAGSMEERAKAAMDARMYNNLSDPSGNGAVRVYSRLSSDQIVQLRNTGEIVLSSDEISAALPGTLLDDLKKGQAESFSSFGDVFEKGPDDQIRLETHLRLDSSQPGRNKLSIDWRSFIREGADVPGMAPHASFSRGGLDLDTGVPDQLLDPNNAASHMTERSAPAFAGKVTLAPRPQAPPTLAEGSPTVDELKRIWYLSEPAEEAGASTQTGAVSPGNARDWVDSADVLKEIHRITGRNILSDYYLRVYPRSTFAYENSRLVDLLNNVADGLKSSWVSDGTFLRLRRFDYYTQRLQDIPHRQLAPWKMLRDKQGYLGMNEMSEIASLPDRIKGDLRLEQAVMLKWNLLEWPLATGLGAKPLLRVYASLDTSQHQRLQSDSGLSFAEMTPAQLDLLRQSSLYIKGGIDPQNLGVHHLYMRVRGPGRYSWEPPTHSAPSLVFPGKESVYETRLEKAKAGMEAALKSHPEVRTVIEKDLPNLKQWRPWATVQSELDGQITGPATQIWTSIQSGDEYMTFYTG